MLLLAVASGMGSSSCNVLDCYLVVLGPAWWISTRLVNSASWLLLCWVSFAMLLSCSREATQFGFMRPEAGWAAMFPAVGHLMCCRYRFSLMLIAFQWRGAQWSLSCGALVSWALCCCC